MNHDCTRLTAHLVAALAFLGLAPGAASARSTFEAMFKDYDAMRAALVEDDATIAKERAVSIREAAGRLEEDFSASKAGVPDDRRQDLAIVLADIAAGATAVEQAKELAAVREAFGSLSDGLVRYRNMLKGTKPVHAYCSMVKKSWLQKQGKLGNPYLGSEMPTCGEIVDQATMERRPRRVPDSSMMGAGGGHGH